MDLWYVLYNTIIYGIIASALAGFFAFGKILNLSIGGFLVASGYIFFSFFTKGFTRGSFVFTLVLILVFLVMNRVLLRWFPNETQRDHVSIVATLWLTIVLENLTNYIYGPNGVSLDVWHITTVQLIILFVLLCSGFYYFFKHTSYGVLYKAMHENTKTLRSLWLSVSQYQQWLFVGLGLLTIFAAFMIINETNMRASDGMFYLIKGLGIMIIVWLQKKEYMFFWALLYVLVEYFLFIEMGYPISFKETFVISIILLLLLFKPEGIFTLRKRKF